MRTSGDWRRIFERNANQLLAIPWELGAELTADETRDLSRSVAEFQRGESGEGRRLIRYADEFARRTGDDEYSAAIRLFVREEQRHARDLARFLELNQIPLARATVTDGVFRGLRHLLGTLEISIAVLITAELIAQVYYDALRRATRSAVLASLCEQILNDEERHVQFQSERLGILGAGRGALLRWLTTASRRGLFAFTCLAIWPVHGRAFQRGGFTFVRFWREAWSCFDRAALVTERVRLACQSRRSSPSSRRVSPSPRRSRPRSVVADAPPASDTSPQ